MVDLCHALLEQLHLPNFIIENMYINEYYHQHFYMNPFGMSLDLLS